MAKTQQDNIVRLADKRRESKEQVLERLFREHGSALRGFLRVSLQVGSEMEDIVQEVFAKLAKLDDLQERLPEGKSSNRAFLFTMANNLVVDMERRKRVRRQYAMEQSSDAVEQSRPDDSPEAITLAEQELAVVKDVLKQMRPCWREAFILNRFRYRSYSQIAIDMNISVKTVEKYIKKALMQIRKAVLEIKGVESP